MKYQVPLRWFATAGRDDVRIVDERGRAAFRLDGGLSPLPAAPAPVPRPTAGDPPAAGGRLSFKDRRGDELAFITHRTLPGSGAAAFEIYHGDDLQAVVRRDGCSPRQCRFTAEGPDDLHAEGDLTGREYSFTREGRTVGRVSRQLLSTAGVYAVEVGRGEDEVLLLASAAVIDLCCQPDAAADSGRCASRMVG